MADVEQAIRRALESRLASTIVATTGSASISATATGYARAAGSFVSDGFKVGDTVKGSGFSNSANNGYGIITAVSALSMTVDVDRTAEAAGTRTLDVVMPEKRKYEGQKVEHVPSRPMVRAAVVPVSAPLVAFGDTLGLVRHQGIFAIDFYEPVDDGFGLARVERLAQAARVRFRIGTGMTQDGFLVRVENVRTNPIVERPEYLQKPVTVEYFCDAAN